MDLKINDKKIHKEGLIKLLSKNKLQTIVHLRNVLNIGLKDAKEIVENLADNPNYYDNAVVKIPEKEFVEGESIILDSESTSHENIRRNTEKKVGSHVIKEGNTNEKWIYAFGLIFIITLLYLLLIE